MQLKYVLAGLLIASTPAFADDAAAVDASATAGDTTVSGEAAVTTDPNAGAAATTTGGEMEAPAKKMSIGADVAFVLPLGDYADAASFAVGALARFEYNVNPMLAVTARAGYLYNNSKNDGFSLGMIPILVGAAYKIGTSGLFVDGEIGVTNIRVSIDIGGQSASDSKTKLSVQAGVGYAMNKLKFRAGFFMPGSFDSGNGSSTLYGVMASAGYDFASF